MGGIVFLRGGKGGGSSLFATCSLTTVVSSLSILSINFCMFFSKSLTFPNSVIRLESCSLPSFVLTGERTTAEFADFELVLLVVSLMHGLMGVTYHSTTGSGRWFARLMADLMAEQT